ncbi:hypothetical protein VUR80DRAFT_2259 [Thermomyces stellatus]
MAKRGGVCRATKRFQSLLALLGSDNTPILLLFGALSLCLNIMVRLFRDPLMDSDTMAWLNHGPILSRRVSFGSRKCSILFRLRAATRGLVQRRHVRTSRPATLPRQLGIPENSSPLARFTSGLTLLADTDQYGPPSYHNGRVVGWHRISPPPSRMYHTHDSGLPLAAPSRPPRPETKGGGRRESLQRRAAHLSRPQKHID